jgi:Fe-Mn family superoxide dismutase
MPFFFTRSLIMHQLSRRELLLTAGAGAAALAVSPLTALAQAGAKPAYTLPKLPYAYDALEPHIDKETMMIHHDKHHQAYVDNLNKFLSKQPSLYGKPIDEVLREPDKIDKDIRTAVLNNGGGHANHTMFWEIMAPKAGGKPSGALAKAIDASFGSFDKFQEAFSTAAIGVFGSGWAWLVPIKGKLEIVQKPNQFTPVNDGHTPILGIDVWEHAYYLKYRNLRAAYIKAWWNVVNWPDVAARYAKAGK